MYKLVYFSGKLVYILAPSSFNRFHQLLVIKAVVVCYFSLYFLFVFVFVFVEGQNSTAFNTPRFDEFGGTLVTVIMALYLLVANILLLNLLIAIFK